MRSELGQAIYLDHLATTPLSERSKARMLSAYEDHFANTSSLTHRFGVAAECYLETCRQEIAATLDAGPQQVIFTGGATESNNTVFNVVHELASTRPFHVIISQFEHKCVIESARALERHGHAVTMVAPQSNGVMNVREIRDAIRPNTRIVSVMMVNNELGTIQPVGDIAREVRATSRSIFVHTDASQAFGKIPLSFRDLGVHAMSLSAHKLYGPKGVGCLVLGDPSFLARSPFLRGGSQEFGARAGTVNLPGIAGFAAAAIEAVDRLSRDGEMLASLAAEFVGVLTELDVPWQPNVPLAGCVPGVVNLRIQGVPAAELLGLLGGRIAISTGSACSSRDQRMSHVLESLGLGERAARESLRISFGRSNTRQHAREAAISIRDAVRKILVPSVSASSESRI